MNQGLPGSSIVKKTIFLFCFDKGIRELRSPAQARTGGPQEVIQLPNLQTEFPEPRPTGQAHPDSQTTNLQGGNQNFRYVRGQRISNFQVWCHYIIYDLIAFYNQGSLL